MQCPHCSTDVPDSAAFCSGCGRRLADAPAQHTGQPLGKSPAPPDNTGAAVTKSQRADSCRAATWPSKSYGAAAYSYKAMTGTLIAVGLLTVIVVLAVLVQFKNDQWFWICRYCMPDAAMVGRRQLRCFAAGWAFNTG